MASLSVPSASIRRPARMAALLALLCGLTAAVVVLAAIGDPVIAAGFLGGAIVLFGIVIGIRAMIAPAATVPAETDWSVARALAEASSDAVAVTDRAGRLICANNRYQLVFGGFPTPPNLPVGETQIAELASAGRAAWRDGVAGLDRLMIDAGPIAASIERAGEAEDMLVWRFAGAQGADLAATVEAMIGGTVGNRLATAGIMTALITADGRIRAANRVFRVRAMGHEEGAIAGRDFARFLITDGQGMVRFEREGLKGTPLRVVQIPFIEGDDAPLLVALLDEEETTGPAIGANASAHVRSLVSLMPFGIALIDREGRFLQMNDAFVRAADVDPAAPPLYPGDLVVREDKAAVADAVRRFAGGATHSADMAVRL
ncbi:MAG: PAS domain-containing protein, partial [Sphingomonas sp.]|nr:PAS domain-containing protein [Sphingomonas sp.]